MSRPVRTARLRARDLMAAPVRAYRLLLSPWLGSQCRFEPTCSIYALQALELHGARRGSWLAAGRILRCHPWCDGGHDPVPSVTRPVFPNSPVSSSSSSSSGSAP